MGTKTCTHTSVAQSLGASIAQPCIASRDKTSVSGWDSEKGEDSIDSTWGYTETRSE